MEFEEQPIKKCYVYEVIKHTPQQFMNIYSTGISNFLRWANGVVFVCSTFPDTDDMIKDRIKKGIVHMKIVEYSYMNEMVPSINNTVPVIDFSSSALFNQLTLWLKKRDPYGSPVEVNDG